MFKSYAEEWKIREYITFTLRRHEKIKHCSGFIQFGCCWYYGANWVASFVQWVVCLIHQGLLWVAIFSGSLTGFHWCVPVLAAAWQAPAFLVSCLLQTSAQILQPCCLLGKEIRFTGCPAWHVLIRNLVSESQDVFGQCWSCMNWFYREKDQVLLQNVTATNHEVQQLPSYFWFTAVRTVYGNAMPFTHS